MQDQKQDQKQDEPVEHITETPHAVWITRTWHRGDDWATHTTFIDRRTGFMMDKTTFSWD